MKLKIRRGQYLGDKIIGFIYSECYSETVYGIMFWSYGIFLTIGNSEEEEDDEDEINKMMLPGTWEAYNRLVKEGKIIPPEDEADRPDKPV